MFVQCLTWSHHSSGAALVAHTNLFLLLSSPHSMKCHWCNWRLSWESWGMESNKQRLLYFEIKFSPGQLQCGEWKVYRLPGKCFSEDTVRNKAGFSELSASSQNLGEMYFLRTQKTWGWFEGDPSKVIHQLYCWAKHPKKFSAHYVEDLKSLKFAKTDSLLNKDYWNGTAGFCVVCINGSRSNVLRILAL